MIVHGHAIGALALAPLCVPITAMALAPDNLARAIRAAKDGAGTWHARRGPTTGRRFRRPAVDSGPSITVRWLR
jgi:hypothetical protein